MNQSKKYFKAAASVLFVIYLFILGWIVLYKLRFSMSDIQPIRSVNFLPFHYSVAAGEKTHIREVTLNVLLFVPFGIFLSMLAPNLKLWKKLAVMTGVSLTLETAQYIFAIGTTDITDLITNTLGGIIGIALYWLILTIFKNKQKVDAAITVAAAIAAVLFLGLFAILIAFN